MSKKSIALGVAALLGGACAEPENTDNDPICTDLAAGSVVISEFLANPDGSDEGLEWFEVVNATAGSIDLGGVRAVLSKNDFSSEESYLLPSYTAEAGEYVVLGDVATEFSPDHVDIGYGFELGSMRNSDGRIALYCGETLLDEFLYDDVPDGQSLAFNGGQMLTSQSNDDINFWCEGQGSFDQTENQGSPGTANNACEIIVPGKCDDGAGLRDIVRPGVGELVITEVTPNPSLVADTIGEWVEVYATASFDLNELDLGTEVPDVRQTIERGSCLSATAGDRFVFARSDVTDEMDPDFNGGVTQVDLLLEFSLTNSNSGLFISSQGTVIDSIAWTSVPNGASLQLDPDSRDATANDDPLNWCEATMSLNPMVVGADSGSPGSMNEQCPVVVQAGQCIDGGVPRAINYPSPGQLEISEFMANPATIADGDGEWIELRVNATFDINELGFGRDHTGLGTQEEELDIFGAPDCQTVSQGDVLLFAINDGSNTSNGGLPALDGLFTKGLRNSSGGRELSFYADGQLIVSYDYSGESGSASSGNSWSFDGATWCADDINSYGDPANNNYGTPLAQNRTCN